jgi:16S rRNA (uracil1498-N3)-methyltransferase
MHSSGGDSSERMERGATRLYTGDRLCAGATLTLAGGQAHRVRSVLRLRPGDTVSAFNAIDGEWLCRIVDIGRGAARIAVEHQLRTAQAEPDLWLLFAPVKRVRLDWLVEKATELGVSVLLPVWTARTQVERLNLDRLRAHAVAAAEQSERLSVPEIREPVAFGRLLTEWPAERRLILCDESGDGRPPAEALAGSPAASAALLVGPEGGFAESELDAVLKLSFVKRIGLGPRVLRADTAALAGLAVYQAFAGDWHRPRRR